MMRVTVSSDKDLTPSLYIAIEIKQTGADSFTLIYGKQVKAGLLYYEAAMELGVSIMDTLMPG